MMYSGMMNGFGMVFGLIYLGLVLYFFYLLNSMAKSLGQIAKRMDKLPLFDDERNKQG